MCAARVHLLPGPVWVIWRSLKKLHSRAAMDLSHEHTRPGAARRPQTKQRAQAAAPWRINDHTRHPLFILPAYTTFWHLVLAASPRGPIFSHAGKSISTTRQKLRASRQTPCAQLCSGPGEMDRAAAAAPCLGMGPGEVHARDFERPGGGWQAGLHRA